MPQNANLRFLLALGNTKIVLVEQDKQLHTYSSKNTSRKATVHAQHITDAVAAR